MDDITTQEKPPQKNQIYFSIIIPMYNRATTIRRCLDSCLSQGFGRYEVIVVDDGSEDDSIAVVESYLPNPKIKLLKKPKNRGVCFARGLGVKHARGKWIMFIGSDDAFNPGAFQTIFEETNKAPKEVCEIKFCYFCEGINKITPTPMLPEGILGLPEYLTWFEDLSQSKKETNSNYLYCQRREIYDSIAWPTDRQYETLYHLQVAAKFKMIMSRSIVATVYVDAPNRITKSVGSFSSAKEEEIARDNALSRAKILKDYKEQLKQYCPNRYKSLHRNVGRLYMEYGERLKGCRYLLKYLMMRPFSLSGWGILILGLIQRDALNWCLRKLGR